MITIQRHLHTSLKMLAWALTCVLFGNVPGTYKALLRPIPVVT